jgi:DNA-binding NtrC family response regulator
MNASAGNASSYRIIYIDDDKGFGMLTKFQLECMGHLVTVFEIPEDALDALALTPKAWDMVITDLRVLGLNGLKVARSVRDLHPGLCHGLISGCPGGGIAREAAAAGLAPILPKPTSLEELDSLVGRIVGQCRPAPANHAALPSSKAVGLLDEWCADFRCI